jgi:hypothetical protein
MGRRLVPDVPHEHWKTTTIVAALRSNGMTTPTVAEQQLAPTLRAGDVVLTWESSAAAEAFTRADQDVANGPVTARRVRAWTTVVGELAEVKLPLKVTC